MKTFAARKPTSRPVISTASLPDIVFMLLFFFMVTTVMRSEELLVLINPPQADQAAKVEKRSLVSYVYIGQPLENPSAPIRLQLNDAFASVADIGQFVEQERKPLPEQLVKKHTVSFKVDQKAAMGMVTDIKQELRKKMALKVIYATTQGRSH